MNHKLHEGYSAKNPVPKVALKSILDPSGATETKAKNLRKRNDQDEEKEQDSTQRAAKNMAKGKELQVRDPITGEETTVKHGGDEEHHADTRAKGENVLNIDFPPPSELSPPGKVYHDSDKLEDWSAHRSYVLNLTKSAIIKIMASYILTVFVVLCISSLPTFGLRHTIWQAHPVVGLGVILSLSLAPPTLLAYSLLFALDRKSAEDFMDHMWDSERARGLAAGEDRDGDGLVQTEERIKESAEWLNTLLKGVWPIANPNLFDSAIDLLEDIMQASVPKFIHSVRVSDLGQGLNPMRITSIRSLPDVDTHDALQDADDEVKEHLLRDHINLEVSFAYRALPSGSTASSKAHNAHLLLDFYLGLKGTYEFNLPVWVELTGVSGTARVRLEVIPDPPFIKTTLLTLMGLPRISISVTPMARNLPNVMNIPVLSSFISSAIDTACAEYVAPRSLTLDMQQLISGDDIKKDTMSIGVVIVHIHRGIGLKKMDSRESSDTDSADPYVTVAYAKQGKPLFSTRIIFADLNPIFEESAAVTVDANAIKIREKLCLQLWDSDRTSADDMMGYVEIDILELMRNKNKPKRVVTNLMSPDSDSRPGALEYTVGYYPKMAPNGKLQTDGSDPAIPEDLKKSDPDFQEARAVALNDLEAAVLVTPPDPDWPSGILSVQVHEIRDLKLRTEGKERGLLGQNRKEGQKGQDDDGEEQEEGSDLPSSYCTISINDNLIYSTRVKPITSTPIFNAGTERFVRDWRSAHVAITVRDSRLRENDPILGLIFLKLSDLLVNASEVTRFFPLENGLGYGSARVSVLFRPVQASLPPSLLGFDYGTLVISKVTAKLNDDRDSSSMKSCDVKFQASNSFDKLSRKNAELAEDGSVTWNEEETPSEIAVRQRYSTALVITFKETGAVSSGTYGMAILWLRDVIDGEATVAEVAIFKSRHDYDRLRQNYVPPDGSLEMWDVDREKMERIGTARIDLTLVPGIGDAHRKIMGKADQQQRRMWDEIDRRQDTGIQEQVGQQEQRGATDENTEVSQEDVSDETHHHDGEDENGTADGATGYSLDGRSDSEYSDSNDGLLDKLREWKRHEKELHKQHRGTMQMKPFRTAKWLKDNTKEAGHKVADRFKMQSREPDVETEV